MKSDYTDELEAWISERVEIIKFERYEIEYLEKQAKHLKVIAMKKQQRINLSMEHIKKVAQENGLINFLTLCMDGKKKSIKPKPPEPPKPRRINEGGQIYRTFEKLFKFKKR